MDHEVRDDAVEDDAVVVSSLGESREVFASLFHKIGVSRRVESWRWVLRHTFGAWSL